MRPDGYTPRMWKGREAAVRRQIMLSLSYGNSGARMLLVRGRERRSGLNHRVSRRTIKGELRLKFISYKTNLIRV